MSINEGMKQCKNGIRNNQKTFYSDGIRKLVNRWTKFSLKQGDYVGKQAMSK
jgi:hypothetical protein